MADCFNPNEVANSIVATLMKPEQTRFTSFIDYLVDKNISTGKTELPGFLFSGEFYCKPEYQRRQFKGTPLTTLHPSLNLEMDQYCFDKAKVSVDTQVITQLVFLLLRKAKNYQDSRNMCPDVFTKLSLTMAEYKRTVPFEQCHPKSLLDQTEKIMPVIYSYLVSELFY